MVETADLLFFGHVGAFALSALACFAGANRARSVDDPDTRRGLVALLLTSGGWATAHVGYFLAPTNGLRVAFYVVGLVVGIGAVGPWLYFCSAYTGRTLHRNPTIRTVAVGVFLGIVLVKVTNPLHHLYFTTAVATEPFPHLAVREQLLHWVVMGLSYALASVGYFVLFERFLQVGSDTKPLVALTAITGLPLVFDLVGFATPLLVDVTYEPLGVAAFALGVGYVYRTRFSAVRIAGTRDGPLVVLDAEDRIREFDDEARALFPALDADVLGRPVQAVLPVVADVLDEDSSIVEVDRDGDTRYYRATVTPFGGRARVGRLVILHDVTEREQYRRELERQNERLDAFAEMVSHDLRNPIEVAHAGVELARVEKQSHHLDEIENALDRMDELVENVLALARQGQPIDDVERVELSDIVHRCWRVVDAGDATLEVEEDLTFRADPDRLQQLLENLFRNAVEHGSTSSQPSADDALEHGSTGPQSGTGDSVERGGPTVTIRVGPLDDGTGFYVADDGPGIPADERDRVFDTGYSTATDGTGFGLAIVGEIVEAHGWSIAVTESVDGGARFEIAGVERVDDRSTDPSKPATD